MRSPKAIVLITAMLGAGLAAAGPSVAATTYAPQWSTTFDGWNRSSSPAIADIDGDGENEIVMGHQDGVLRAFEADGTLKWSSPAIPGVNTGCNAQTTASAIDSSPAVADLDQDGTAEIIVGVGSTWVSNQNGGVIAFDGVSGAIEWRTALGVDHGSVWDNTSVPDGWCEGVFASPAVGDVDGDGQLDVVFAGFDWNVWAVDHTGAPLHGFPVVTDDSIWSSPALFDVDADGDLEIFIGGDSTPGGPVDHLGGVLWALDVEPTGVTELWRGFANEVFHSSGAIGDINDDGRMEIVIGTGHNWRIECAAGNHLCGPGDGSDTNRLFAFHLHDGSTVPGFPVTAEGTLIGSPALGDIDDDGQLEIVVGSEDAHVYAWNGDGSLLWRVQRDDDDGHPSIGPGAFAAGAIIADLQGDGRQDVAIGSNNSMVLLDGATGASLEAGVYWNDRVAFAQSFEAAPAVGVFGGERRLVVASFDTPSKTSKLTSYALPASDATDAWPMFGRDAARSGTSDLDAVTCGFRQSGTFCDVAVAKFFHDPVLWMVREGITTGVSNDRFEPDWTLSRAQMVTFLWREAGGPTGNPAHGVEDVPDDAYFAEAVRWAKVQDITKGTTTTTFSPHDPVTRGQLVTLLWRREGEPDPADTTSFNDVPEGRYFTQAVGWAKASGVTQGSTPTTFSPDLPVTRGQAATFLYRAAGEPAV